MLAQLAKVGHLAQLDNPEQLANEAVVGCQER